MTTIYCDNVHQAFLIRKQNLLNRINALIAKHKPLSKDFLQFVKYTQYGEITTEIEYSRELVLRPTRLFDEMLYYNRTVYNLRHVKAKIDEISGVPITTVECFGLCYSTPRDLTIKQLPDDINYVESMLSKSVDRMFKLCGPLKFDSSSQARDIIAGLDAIKPQ